MKIQQFADQLKREDPSPLLRALQDLRTCTLAQLHLESPGELGGWNPWTDEGGETIPPGAALRN